jgi:hypothetical protein
VIPYDLNVAELVEVPNDSSPAIERATAITNPETPSL